jgi:hypothetical protein
MTHTFKKTIGTRAEVFHLTAKKTSGGLTRRDLIKNKKGRIVSKKQQAHGRRQIKKLFALGYKPKKGTFKLMRKSMVDGRRKKQTKKDRKRGGAAGLASFEDASAM